MQLERRQAAARTVQERGCLGIGEGLEVAWWEGRRKCGVWEMAGWWGKGRSGRDATPPSGGGVLVGSGFRAC